MNLLVHAIINPVELAVLAVLVVLDAIGLGMCSWVCFRVKNAIVEIAHYGRIELVKEARSPLPEDAIRGVEYFVGEILAPGGASIAMTIRRMSDQARANLVPVAMEFRRQLRGD
jgi:hypothetical protein